MSQSSSMLRRLIFKRDDKRNLGLTLVGSDDDKNSMLEIVNDLSNGKFNHPPHVKEKFRQWYLTTQSEDTIKIISAMMNEVVKVQNKIILIGMPGAGKSSMIMNLGIPLGSDNKVSSSDKDGTIEITQYTFENEIILIDTPGCCEDNMVDLCNSLTLYQGVVSIFWFVAYNNIRARTHHPELLLLKHIKSCSTKELKIFMVVTQGSKVSNPDIGKEYEKLYFLNDFKVDQIANVIRALKSSQPGEFVNSWNLQARIDQQIISITNLERQNIKLIEDLKHTTHELTQCQSELNKSQIALNELRNFSNETQNALIKVSNTLAMNEKELGKLQTLEVDYKEVLMLLNNLKIHTDNLRRRFGDLDGKVDCWGKIDPKFIKECEAKFNEMMDVCSRLFSKK